MITPSQVVTRDEWVCDTCGSGLCVRGGDEPESSQHIAANGRVCGRYVFAGPCRACVRDQSQALTNFLREAAAHDEA